MNALHPLGQLFQSVEDSRGWTLREIARRATKAGYEISHQYVARLKRSDLKSISRELIAALGAGLDVPERVVGIAALESMGVHDVDPSEADLAATIARDSSLTERDRRVLLAAVREMQREQDDEQDGERAAPTAGGGGVEDPAERHAVTPANVPRRSSARSNARSPAGSSASTRSAPGSAGPSTPRSSQTNSG